MADVDRSMSPPADFSLLFFPDYYPEISPLNGWHTSHFENTFQSNIEGVTQRMGFPFNPFKGRQPGNTPTATPPAQPPPNHQQPERTTGPLPSTGHPEQPHLQTVQGGQLNLVNYSPEELIQDVHKTISTVHFGMSSSTTFMETIAEFWAVAGPIVLLAGTAGEVFAFIWMNTSSPAWWVAMSILATVIVLEATFMVVSYKSSTIRDRAEKRAGGPTDLDKAKLKRYRATWFTLAFGVGSGQVAFLISAMDAKTNSALIGVVAFVMVRTVMTLLSDFYTAFVHEPKPTDGEQAKQQKEQEAQLASQLLAQKTHEVTIINNGIIGLQRAHTEAQIQQDNLHTELELKKQENKTRIETLREVQAQAAMFNRLGSNVIRALFDPELAEEQRQKLLGTMQALMSASQQQLPSPRITEQTEEEEEGA